jgi:two-component system, NarL family, response regulator YdfI
MSAASKNGSGSIRVAVASTSSVRRAGLEALVKSTPSLRMAASLGEVQDLLQRVDGLQADAVIVDLHSQFSLTVPIRDLPIPVLALVDNPDPAWTAQALRSGIKSILPRDADAEQIRAAILAANSGLVLLGAEVSQGLAKSVRTQLQPDISVENLTTRELEVLGMLAEGLSNRQIADRLRLSDHTIKFHISSILDKLGVSTRTEAVTAGLRMGLILL